LETLLSGWRKIKSSWKRSFQDGVKSRALGNAPFRMEKNQELLETLLSGWSKVKSSWKKKICLTKKLKENDEILETKQSELEECAALRVHRCVYHVVGGSRPVVSEDCSAVD
jgi:hypothetical protein